MPRSVAGLYEGITVSFVSDKISCFCFPVPRGKTESVKVICNSVDSAKYRASLKPKGCAKALLASLCDCIEVTIVNMKVKILS